MAEWVIPSRVVEYREVHVEAETKAEAMRKYRAREWVEGSDPDDTRSEVYKVGAIEKLPERRPSRHSPDDQP